MNRRLVSGDVLVIWCNHGAQASSAEPIGSDRSRGGLGVGRHWLRCVALCVALAGCTTINLAPNGERKTLLGIVRITLPDKAGDFAAIDAKTLGAGWDDGFFLGLRNASWVIASPEQCQLLVIVRSKVEAANAAQVLDRLKGEPICVADYTRSLHPAAR